MVLEQEEELLQEGDHQGKNGIESLNDRSHQSEIMLLSICQNREEQVQRKVGEFFRGWIIKQVCFHRGRQLIYTQFIHFPSISFHRFKFLHSHGECFFIKMNILHR